jgi:hypothetical protein
LREKGAALMQQAFAIAYVNIVFLYSTLFGWAMALCITILPGVIVGWRLQSADASIWTYALSAEALLPASSPSVMSCAKRQRTLTPPKGQKKNLRLIEPYSDGAAPAAPFKSCDAGRLG